MTYLTWYQSPLGKILLAADEQGLTGLWFENQKYFADTLGEDATEIDTAKTGSSSLQDAKRWLDIYFAGKEPEFTPAIHMKTTEFRRAVWEILLKIPYGQTTTYGEIAKLLAKQKGLSSMSAQAVGGAVGHNSISLIIPCHRVVGADGSLTGYAGGIDKKIKLLQLEKTGEIEGGAE